MYVQGVCDFRIYESSIGEPTLATKDTRKCILIIQVVTELKYASDMSLFPYSRVSPIYLFIVFISIFYLHRHIARHLRKYEEVLISP